MDLAKIEQLAVDDVQVVADGDGLATVSTPGVVTVTGADPHRHCHCGPPLCDPVHTHAAPVRVRPADPVPGT